MYSSVRVCLFIMLSSVCFAQETGSIAGTVVDKINGDPLISASVRVEGTALVGFADLDGKYLFRGVTPGTYTVVANFDGFAEMKVEKVVVASGKTTKCDFDLGPDTLQESMVVSAELREDNEVSLMRHRQKAAAVSDAIGGEEISRGGGGNAADAVTKITGASVVGGKYVFIRGLGDRYTSTHLNGVEMPTADPDTKAFHADLLPANILENIVTVKSFTPEKPGNFSGGIIDIGTKTMPTELTFDVSIKGSYNTQVTGEDDILTYAGGGNDWAGSDDGSRALPEILAGGTGAVPTIQQARRDEALANRLDAVSRAFTPVMVPSTHKAPYNQGYAVSLGNRHELFGNELGYLASVNYSRNFTGYNDRQIAHWKLTESATDADDLVNQSSFIGQEGKDAVNWGGLLTLNYNMAAHSRLNFNAIYTQSGESIADAYAGAWPDQFADEATVLESRVLKYSERNLTSFQLGGEHVFERWNGTTLKWSVSDSTSQLDEPDTRIFTSHSTLRDSPDGPVTVYSIARSNYNNPARYWRELEEDGETFSLDLGTKLPSFNSLEGTLSIGLASDRKTRDFHELRYEYAFDSGVRYDGNSDSVFGPDVIGLRGFNEQRQRYEFGSVLQLAPDAAGGDYNGDQTVDAAYAMAELPITAKLRTIVGARYEAADMEVTNGVATGTLDNKDVLPSLNFIYESGGNTNYRFSYGRTLARPNFREKAPYASYDFIADGIFVGNPDLERTLIDNLDLRWERFPRGGELMAATVFYKQFENPIERAYNPRYSSEFGEKTYINVDEATVYGLELEYRKRFDQAVLEGNANHLFSVGTNLSLIRSEVDIPAEELAFILLRDPDHSPTRKLQGQSPYLVNLSLNYDSANGNTAASLYYNVFGERLDEVGVGGAPDAVELPRGQLDFTLMQSLYRHLKLKFLAKNLLDEPVEIVQKFKSKQYIQTHYKTGASYSISLSYKP